MCRLQTSLEHQFQLEMLGKLGCLPAVHHYLPASEGGRAEVTLERFHPLPVVSCPLRFQKRPLTSQVTAIITYGLGGVSLDSPMLEGGVMSARRSTICAGGPVSTCAILLPWSGRSRLDPPAWTEAQAGEAEGAWGRMAHTARVNDFPQASQAKGFCMLSVSIRTMYKDT